MSPDQRATKVCEKRFKHEFRELNQKEASISYRKRIIAAGYKEVQQCENKPVKTGTSCRSFYGTVTCEDEIEQQKVCRNVPVVINHEYETARLEAITVEYNELLTKIKSEYQSCHASITTMPAEEAYSYF